MEQKIIYHEMLIEVIKNYTKIYPCERNNTYLFIGDINGDTIFVIAKVEDDIIKEIWNYGWMN